MPSPAPPITDTRTNGEPANPHETLCRYWGAVRVAPGKAV